MKRIKYLLRFVLIYFTFLSRKQNTSYLPLRLWVETSARCNLKCRLCINRDMAENAKGNMDFNLYKKIVDEVKDYVFDINLFHRGEPLMNPLISDMVSYAHKNNIRTRLHTNATLLNPDISGKLIKAGLDFISFSFDGYDADTYEKNRIGADYNKTLANIIEFLAIKKKIGSKTPYAQLQVMEYDDSTLPEQFARTKRAFSGNFEGLPLNRFTVRVPHNWGGSLMFKKGEIKGHGNYGGYTACTFPWYALTVLFDGKVLPCPQDFYGAILLGDVNDETIKSIFNNNKMIKLRRSFLKQETVMIKPCGSCDRCRRKTFLGAPKEYMGLFIKDIIKK